MLIFAMSSSSLVKISVCIQEQKNHEIKIEIIYKWFHKSEQQIFINLCPLGEKGTEMFLWGFEVSAVVLQGSLFLLEFFPMRQKATAASGRGKRKCRGLLPPQRAMRGRSEEEQEAPSAGKSPLSIQHAGLRDHSIKASLKFL